MKDLTSRTPGADHTADSCARRRIQLVEQSVSTKHISLSLLISQGRKEGYLELQLSQLHVRRERILTHSLQLCVQVLPSHARLTDDVSISLYVG